MKNKVEELKQVKEQIDALYRKKEELEKEIDDLVIYQNEDGIWTRFMKTDTLKELEEKGTIFRTCIKKY